MVGSLGSLFRLQLKEPLRLSGFSSHTQSHISTQPQKAPRPRQVWKSTLAENHPTPVQICIQGSGSKRGEIVRVLSILLDSSSPDESWWYRQMLKVRTMHNRAMTECDPSKKFKFLTNQPAGAEWSASSLLLCSHARAKKKLLSHRPAAALYTFARASPRGTLSLSALALPPLPLPLPQLLPSAAYLEVFELPSLCWWMPALLRAGFSPRFQSSRPVHRPVWPWVSVDGSRAATANRTPGLRWRAANRRAG